MSSDHQKYAVAVVTSTSSTSHEKNQFGSAFLIGRDEKSTYWLTCAHVIDDVGGDEPARVNGHSVELIAPEKEQLTLLRNGCDLAIVKVEGLLDEKPFELSEAAIEGRKFFIVGYSQEDTSKVRRRISGCLGEPAVITLGTDNTSAWHLEIDSNPKYTLQAGYSGSPVIDQETGYVIGVVTQVEWEGKKQGLAIAIESLRKVAGDLPINFLKAVHLQNLSDADLRKNLALTAASNELEQLRQDLQRFFEERKAIELKIQDIEIKIQELNIEVEDDDHDPGRASLLQKLQKQSELAKKYGDLTINKFPIDLKEMIETHPEDLDYFYLDIETCITRLYYTLSFNDVTAVDDITLKLPLVNKSRYGDQGSDAYLELFKLLKKGLTYGTSGESKNLLLQGLDSIEEQISLSS